MPTIPALARARRHLDRLGQRQVTLIVTGGLRVPADFVKALALGADGIAVSNAAIQAIGCLAMRACHTDNCPVGIATQKPTCAEGSSSSSRREDSNASSSRRPPHAGDGPSLRHTHVNRLALDDLTTYAFSVARR